MKKQMNKKRVFAFLAVFLVLVTVLCVPVFAFSNEQIGISPYQTVTDLSSFFGRSYEGNQTLDMYTLCIDVDAVCRVIVSEGVPNAASSLYLDLELETLLDIVTVNVDIFDTAVLTDTVLSIYVNDSAVIEMTLQEVQSSGGGDIDSTFVLVPFSIGDGLTIMDSGWLGPYPPYQIFNNNQLSNTGNYTNGYNVGFNTGREVGQEEGFQQGYDQSSDDQGIASAGAQLITSVVEAPVNVFSRMLNFEIFGVNVLGFVVAILSFALVIAILKKVL